MARYQYIGLWLDTRLTVLAQQEFARAYIESVQQVSAWGTEDLFLVHQLMTTQLPKGNATSVTMNDVARFAYEIRI